MRNIEKIIKDPILKYFGTEKYTKYTYKRVKRFVSSNFIYLIINLKTLKNVLVQ